MSKLTPDRNNTHSTFIKLKPSHILKSSFTLPELPPVSFLKISDNHTVKTRVLSELAAFKLKSDKSSFPSTNTHLTLNSSREKHKTKTKTDQSLLFTTLGLLNNSTSRQLPTDISKLKDVLSASKVPDKLALGSPATREDTEVLASWLDTMLKHAFSENTDDIEGLCETAMLIYEVCFHEIVRQVSVQCVERGDLINRVWKAYLGILEKALKISKAVQQHQCVEFEEEKQAIHKGYYEEMAQLRTESKDLKEDASRMNRLLKNRDEEIAYMAKKEIRLIEKMQIMQKQYELCKRDLLFIQEDNRIMKAKLSNSSVEFIENAHGVIEPRLVNIQKIKRKNKLELLEVAKADPILSAKMISDEKSEILLKDIQKYENFSRDLLNGLDFADMCCGTDIEYMDQENQTESLQIYVNRQKSVPSEVQLMNLKIENIMDVSDEISEIKELEDIYESSLKKQDTDVYLLKFQDKIDQVNALLERMKQNIQQKIPEMYQQKLLNNLYSSVAESINTMQQGHERDQIQDSFSRDNRGGKKLTFIQKTRTMKKPTLDLIGSLRQKVINTPPHKLKSIIIRKMLLKVIGTFYDAKLKKVSENDRKQDMSQLVAEIYFNKYGMPKVVESKFTQLLASCIKYKTYRRVHLFGRFLKLFEDSTMEDLNFYIDSIAYMKQTFYTENYEELRIPYEKAIDWYKAFLPSVFSETDRIKVKKYLENYKQTDPVSRVCTLEVDAVMEYCVDLLEKNRSDNLDFLQCIYEAGDVRFM